LICLQTDNEKDSKDTKDTAFQIDETSLISEAKTTKGEKWNLKFSSWNVNGVRAWVQASFFGFI